MIFSKFDRQSVKSLRVLLRANTVMPILEISGHIKTHISDNRGNTERKFGLCINSSQMANLEISDDTDYITQTQVRIEEILKENLYFARKAKNDAIIFLPEHLKHALFD